MFILDAHPGSDESNDMEYSPTDPTLLASLGIDGVQIWGRLNKR